MSELAAVDMGPGMVLELDTLVDRDDVKMEMEDRLAGWRLVELHDLHAVSMKGPLRSAGNLLHGRHQPHECRRVGIEEIAGGRLGYDQRVADWGMTSMKARVCSSS
jgi:hypothetical protein